MRRIYMSKEYKTYYENDIYMTKVMEDLKSKKVDSEKVRDIEKMRTFCKEFPIEKYVK